MSSGTRSTPLSYFPSPAFDHAIAGMGAGTAAVLCMQPLDLLKIRFQVDTTRPTRPMGVGRAIYGAITEIYDARGVRGLYRGVGTNIAGNASSWGLYFLFYTYMKTQAQAGDTSKALSTAQYLGYSASASAATALITNPIWVVKVRLYTTTPDSPNAYRGLADGLSSIYRTEGIAGWFRGTLLALVGVSNGAIQFMTYEQLKRLGLEAKRRKHEAAGLEWNVQVDRLSNTTYTVISGASKITALILTYPYQVVRSRIQNNATAHLYPNIRAAVSRTFNEEGARAFYRGLGTNLVRVLPGTCVTFVVYENIAWLFRRAAARRAEAQREDTTHR
ncbi:mitochondrial FAD carrier protein [Auriculariales sp. MPI-PUGE-AT-0066]|nr:mitochondrial FAD carrier protein [Auriculariales sp. MPI-PUGE-AT-0066]